MSSDESRAVTQTYRIEGIFVHRIAFEEVWCIDLEAVESKIVGKKLIRVEQKNKRSKMLGQDRVTGLFGSSRPKTSVI